MFTRLYHRLFSSRLQEIPFIIFLSFLLTFLVARLVVFIGTKDIISQITKGIIINGTHIHHLNFGIVILVIVGYISLTFTSLRHRRLLASLFGIGLGLTFDEFGMWFKLTDNYYHRSSYDAIVVITLILLNIIYFPAFWKRMGKIILKFLNLPRSTYKLIKRKIN